MEPPPLLARRAQVPGLCLHCTARGAQATRPCQGAGRGGRLSAELNRTPALSVPGSLAAQREGCADEGEQPEGAEPGEQVADRGVKGADAASWHLGDHDLLVAGEGI